MVRNEAVRELVPDTSSPDDVTVGRPVPLDATYLRLYPGWDGHTAVGREQGSNPLLLDDVFCWHSPAERTGRSLPW
jgi:hypothetical protein